MAEAPIWPVATDAFVADTMHLSAEETGAYMMLLMCLWRSADATLPLDHKKLSRMARVDPRRWKSVWSAISEFFVVKDGYVTQNRVSKDRLTIREKVNRNRENGRHGGRPKSLKNGHEANPTGSVSVSKTETQTKPIHIHIHKPEEDPPISPPDVFDLWAEICGDILPEVKLRSQARCQAVKRRFDELPNLDSWRDYFLAIRASPFLCGDNDRKWRADFDWALKPANVAKVLEGSYRRGETKSALEEMFR